MPQEFEGDLRDAEFWGADLTGARFRFVDFVGVEITQGSFVDVTVDTVIDRVVINGVDVTAYVNERDPWYPLRTMLTPDAPEEMRRTWVALEAEWDQTIARALALPEAFLHESVDGEFSFVQTLRHLVFAVDKWFTVPLRQGTFAPMGLPNATSVDFPFPGLDQASDPSIGDALAARADRAIAFGEHLATIEPEELTRTVEVFENGESTVASCILTVFEEVFWHDRYAVRDLARIEASR